MPAAAACWVINISKQQNKSAAELKLALVKGIVGKAFWVEYSVELASCGFNVDTFYLAVCVLIFGSLSRDI